MRRWQRAVRDGAIVGALAALVFLAVHAALIEPIWRATPRALAWGAASGAGFGAVLERLAMREPRFRAWHGGLLLGALAALALVPFGIAGWMRERAAPDPFWMLILGLLLVSLYHASLAVQAEAHRWRRLELPAALLLANALPAWLLTFIGDFHDETPDPVPIGAAIALIYAAAGIALGWLREKEDRAIRAPQP